MDLFTACDLFISVSVPVTTISLIEAFTFWDTQNTISYKENTLSRYANSLGSNKLCKG